MEAFVIESPSLGYAVAGIYGPHFRKKGKVWVSERAVNLYLTQYVVFDYDKEAYKIRPFPHDAVIVDLMKNQMIVCPVSVRLEAIRDKKTQKRNARLRRS